MGFIFKKVKNFKILPNLVKYDDSWAYYCRILFFLSWSYVEYKEIWPLEGLLLPNMGSDKSPRIYAIRFRFPYTFK